VSGWDPNRLPSLAPWLDLSNCGASMQAHEPFDWIDRRMADRWTGWYARGADPGQPALSPALADLTGLPPIYIQAGEAEVLLDMIRAFESRARAQSADVRLETWPDMVHDFLAFGDMTRQRKMPCAGSGK
jgi:epsilon-lactone hydrolase